MMMCACFSCGYDEGESDTHAGCCFHETAPEIASRLEISEIEMRCSWQLLAFLSVYSRALASLRRDSATQIERECFDGLGLKFATAVEQGVFS